MTKGAVWGWTLLTLPLQHEQYMEIIHPPPTVSLASHCRAPLWLPSSVYHTRFFSLSHSTWTDTHAHTYTHTLTIWQTVKTQAPSISSPTDSVFSIASFSAFPPFHSQTNRDSFILCLLFRPSLDNLPPSLCPLQENLLRLVHIEYSVKGKRDLLKPGRVSSMFHYQNTATHRSFNDSL